MENPQPTPRDHRCLVCGRTMAAAAYRLIAALCPACARRALPIHPNWRQPGPVERGEITVVYDVPAARRA